MTMKGTIIRSRSKEEMVNVFWGDLKYPHWLAWAIEAELLVCQEEGETESRWCELLRKARRSLKIKDFAQVRRTIELMAKHLNIEIKKEEE